MKAPEFTKTGSSCSMTRLLLGKRSNQTKRSCCTAPGCTYFQENFALVGLVHSSLRWFIHTDSWRLKIRILENLSKSMVNASSHSSSISTFKRLVRTWSIRSTNIPLQSKFVLNLLYIVLILFYFRSCILFLFSLLHLLFNKI